MHGTPPTDSPRISAPYRTAGGSRDSDTFIHSDRTYCTVLSGRGSRRYHGHRSATSNRKNTHTPHTVYTIAGQGIDGDSLHLVHRRHRSATQAQTQHTQRIYCIYYRGAGDRGRLPPPGTSAAPVGDTGSGTHPTHLILYILLRKGNRGRLPPPGTSAAPVGIK